MKWFDRSYVVLFIDVDEPEAVKRLEERYEKEGRKDDHSRSIPRRLEEYKTHTASSIEYFRSLGKVVDIDGEQSPEDVHKEIISKLGI